MENPNNIIGICKDCADKMKIEFHKKNKNLKIKIGDFVKIAVTDTHKNKTEHLWFEVIKTKGKDFIGRCDNEAIIVSMEFNGLHHFKFKDIEGYINGSK